MPTNSPNHHAPRTQKRHRRVGLALIDVIWIISILAILGFLLVPAVQAAREAARRMNCGNNLKGIGLAFQYYHDTFKCFSAGWIAPYASPTTGPSYGWHVSLLPYLEQQPRFDLLDPKGPMPLVTADLQMPLSIFRCPSDVTPEINALRSGYGTSNYSGNHGSKPLPRWLPDRMSQWWPGAADTPLDADGVLYLNGFKNVADITDGTTNTLLASERCLITGAGIWPGVVRNQFENDQVTDCSHLSRPNHSYSSFSSYHPGGVMILRCDATVDFIPNSIDSSDDPSRPGVYQAMGSRGGGESASSGGFF